MIRKLDFETVPTNASTAQPGWLSAVCRPGRAASTEAVRVCRLRFSPLAGRRSRGSNVQVKRSLFSEVSRVLQCVRETAFSRSSAAGVSGHLALSCKWQRGSSEALCPSMGQSSLSRRSLASILSDHQRRRLSHQEEEVFAMVEAAASSSSGCHIRAMCSPAGFLKHEAVEGGLELDTSWKSPELRRDVAGDLAPRLLVLAIPRSCFSSSLFCCALASSISLIQSGFGLAGSLSSSDTDPLAGLSRLQDALAAWRRWHSRCSRGMTCLVISGLSHRVGKDGLQKQQGRLPLRLSSPRSLRRRHAPRSRLARHSRIGVPALNRVHRRGFPELVCYVRFLPARS